jgi:hypothetical protein
LIVNRSVALLTCAVGLTLYGLGEPSKSVAQDVIPTCHTWDGTTRESARQYLKQDRATLEPACIYDAIQLLREDHTTATRKILFGYIDWRRELPRRAPREAVFMSPTDGDYPAADALSFNADDSLIPELKVIMQSEDKNATSRINAARIYFILKPFPPTVAFIADAARNAGDRQAGESIGLMALSKKV